MKYPQLVSTRAVNAISDWLVSRLEQIGVEAPLIYSRLLLSLLHSSVQINDPIEFSNLETYIASRKGSKRISPLDTETFKKFTAVQCLMDAVSSDEEISKVEILVEELCKKLHDIENQNNTEDLIQSPPSIRSTIDTEDPRKRYYRAFPALSKEMEDTVWISKRNSKSLTWPTSNAIATTSVDKNSVMNAFSNTTGVKRKHKRRRNQGMSKGKSTNVRNSSFGGNCSPTWDTDFEGSWEMGRDLIKEFIVKQNNRNRSTSESDACNLRNIENLKKRMKPTEKDDETEEYFSLPQTILDFKIDSKIHTKFDEDQSTVSDVILNEIARSITVNDEGYSTPEGIALFSEAETNSNMARRLYERNISNDSLNIPSSEQNDFALLEAKFNSSVEALWKDKGDNSAQSTHKNLESFWTNYYNHHYDTNKFGRQNVIEPNSDYFSMPNNLIIKENDTSINSMNVEKMMLKNCYPPAGIALSTSIWSDIPQKHDEDESFYANVLGKSYKNKKDDNFGDVKDHLNPYGNSKWSECSFETPFIPATSTASLNETAIRNDTRENTVKNSYLYNYKQHFIPESTTTANNNNNQSTKNTASMQASFAQMSLPNNFSGSLNSFDNIEKVRANSGFKQSTVTLKNHSSTSGFVEVAKLKLESKIIGPPRPTPPFKSSVDEDVSCQQTQKIDKVDEHTMASSRSGATLSPSNEEDNLLTSERTHFRPIKQNYPDGHEFNIPHHYEHVQYERSKSGFLYFESEKYLEYKSSITTTDDDTSGNAFNKRNVHGNYGDSNPEKFSIKFRVKRNEKSCQTDDLLCEDYALPIRKRNTNVCIDEIWCSQDCCMLESEDCFLKEEKSINIDQWSMEEIRKRCLNNNTHTLWGMCSTCNKENKSLPANRLLKDELNMEADEIMSNLKYMQDLYIGSDWEDDADDEDENYNDGDAEMIRQCEFIQILEGTDVEDEQEQIFYNITKLIADLLKPENAKSLANALTTNQGKNIFTNLREEKMELSDVTDSPCEDEKSFTWKRENTNNNNNNNNNNDVQNNNFVNNNNNEKYIGGLWTSDENIIWQKELKPVNEDLWSKIKNRNSFAEKINWEYSNLAEIWNTSPTDKESVHTTTARNLIHIGKTELKNNEIKNLKNLISRNISPHKCCIQNEKPNNNVHFRNKVVNRFDRKRRHSASQNVNTHGSNDFPDNIIIGNKIEIMANQEIDHGKLTSLNDSTATIITCKYWTTFDTSSSSFAVDNPWTINASSFVASKNSPYDGVSGTFALNPSSILKHVTVVSRPLTR